VGLAWINPFYLSGLLLLALPVLIHLVHRQHSTSLKFPSLMFLRQIQWREKRRLEIRHWLLLLLRCLLLLLVVFAFARPFFSGESAIGTLNLERTDSVIVIDRSYSMRLADHWQQAQKIALQLVNAKQARDRIGVVMFDNEAEVISDLTENADNLRTVIARQTPGLKTTRLRVAIEQGARLLAGSNAQLKRVLLVSDFQAVARPAGDLPVISRDIELTAHAIEPADSANTTISSLAIQSPAGGIDDEFALELEVTNHSAKAMVQQLSLSLNGRQLEQRELRLAPGSVAKQIFTGLSPGADLVHGIVSLGDDGLALDNQAYFIHSRRQKVPVLIIEGMQARGNQGVYLENALRLSRQPAFRVERRPWHAVQASELSGWAIIIVNDATIPGGALASALKDFVAAGGGLLVALGEAAQGSWPSADDGFLPGTPGLRIDAKPGVKHRVATFDTDHAFSSASDSRAVINLSSASIFSYRELRPNADDRVLANYDDGGVALAEKRLGQGKALVLTTTLDTHWNDIVLQPVFLPFLHRALRYLADYDAYAREFEVGDIVYVMRYARALAGADAIITAADDGPLVVETPSAGMLRLERHSALLQVDEPGFYQVHRATPANVDVMLAANIDPAEANPRVLDVAGFVEEIRASAISPTRTAVSTRRLAAGYEQQQQLWQLVLSAALVLMLLEAFFANRISAQRARRSGPKS
jgi:hypothetical protein